MRSKRKTRPLQRQKGSRERRGRNQKWKAGESAEKWGPEQLKKGSGIWGPFILSFVKRTTKVGHDRGL